MSITADTTALFEELDYREGDGLEVWLLWNRVADELSVVVYDHNACALHDFVVEARDAVDAFRHPFSYAYLAVPG